MTTLIDEAKNYLEYYLDRKVETDYAVLIKGKWGSGKSHFVTSYLDARDAAGRRKTRSMGAAICAPVGTAFRPSPRSANSSSLRLTQCWHRGPRAC